MNALPLRLLCCLLVARVAWMLTACNGGAQNAGGAAGQGPSGKPAVTVGAEKLLTKGRHLLQHKRIAVVTNHTALCFYDAYPDRGGIHLVDTLLRAGFQVVRVFAPEHGFRGEAEAGKAIVDGKDHQTGLPVVSLYGATKKPKPEHLQDVDLVLFDIQDVGARFYTYCSTLSYVLEACGENNVPLMVLDRPNPNGWYVEGPVRGPGMGSFVGLHAIPIVHGLTLGEYALMVNGQGWMAAKAKLDVMTMDGYRHAMRWEQTGRQWVAPSPNLPTVNAAVFYPILCWYEGTVVSVGRGTDRPFEQFGFPQHTAMMERYKLDSIDKQPPTVYTINGMRLQPAQFVPVAMPGKADNPPQKGVMCWGYRLLEPPPAGPDAGKALFMTGLELLANCLNEWHDYHIRKQLPPQDDKFFVPFFDQLAGTKTLRQQLMDKTPLEQIWNSWQTELAHYRQLRQQYLLYPD